MSKLKERTTITMKGSVCAEYTDGARIIPVTDRSNVITYRAADMIASLIGGDESNIPAYIGYIYAPGTYTMTNPAGNRAHTWDSIASDIRAVNGNMLISHRGAQPYFEKDGIYYTGNAVTVSALSDSTSALVFNGPDYAASPPQAGTDQFFQVVLLSKRYLPGIAEPVYTPFARAQLTDSDSGVDVQAGLDLSVYWTLTFK